MVPQKTRNTGRDSVMAENVPRVFRGERFAGEESVTGMGITRYQSKTWLDLLSSPFFTSSHVAKHGIPLCNAPSSVQFSSELTHHFSASPLKRGICSKPSRKASLHPLPHAQSLPHGQTKELPPPLSSEDPGQLLTGSGLGHDCSVAPAGSSKRSPPAFASSSRAAPASPSSAREPHPLSPSNLRAALKNLNISGQMAGPGLCPKSST